APQRLDRAAACLVIDAAHSGGECRPRGEAALWPRLRLHEQIGQPGSRVLAVARLAREALGENDDHAILSCARAGELDEPDRDIIWQTGRAAGVEPEFDRARHLVDVLSARARGTNKALDDLALVDEEIADFHVSIASRARRRSAPRSRRRRPLRATPDGGGLASPVGPP